MLIKRIFTAGYLLAILVLAVFPFSATGMTSVNKIHVVSFRLDHILHFLAFMPVYPLGIWVLSLPTFPKRLMLLIMGLLFAALAEYVQYFIDYRAYNPTDLLSNIGGVLLGWMIWYIYTRFRH
jgi:VanZ family protein